MSQSSFGPARRAHLLRMLKPRSVAFIGGKWAARSARKCRELGFAGEVWLVNPRPMEVEDARWFPDLAALPCAPDATYLAVRRELSVDMVRELAAMDAGGAVCFAAGFAEIGGDGPALQRALVEAAGEEFAFIGPNCWGFVNYTDSVSLWADTWLRPAPVNGVAIVSQSGNLSITLSSQDRSLPMSYVLSVGNQAMIGPADVIDALTEDERVTGIGLYLETIPDIPAFARAADKAMRRGVPLVAVKVGVTAEAARVAMSHTSSLAGSDASYAALFERLGVVRVHTLSDMLETLKLLGNGGGLPGRRLVSLSCSGGDAALMADHGARHGLRFPPFAPGQAAALREQLALYTSIGNPFDYNTGIWGDGPALTRAFATAIGGECDAAVLVIDTPPGALQYEGEFPAAHHAFAEACRRSSRRGVILSMLPELFPADARERALAGGVVPLQGLAEGMAALGGAAWYGERVRALAQRPLPAPRGAGALLAGEPHLLDEAAAKTLLAAHGLAVPCGKVAGTEEVMDAAGVLGYPVVLKALAAGLAHKSDIGAVAADLRDESALAAALARMRAVLAGVEGVGERFLVESMVDNAVAELIVGVHRDPCFGPVLVLGSGGVLVSLVEDSRTLLLPTTRELVGAALDGLRCARLLQGYRGRPPGDRGAVIDAVLAVAAFAEANAERLLELDVNPLMVCPAGHGAYAVDALLRMVA